MAFSRMYVPCAVFLPVNECEWRFLYVGISAFRYKWHKNVLPSTYYTTRDIITKEPDGKVKLQG
jgi:hypothetical protein